MLAAVALTPDLLSIPDPGAPTVNDDLGRGMLGWTAERWQTLDRIATDTVNEYVILRNLVEHREAPGARTARIAGQNIDVMTIASQPFHFHMEQEEDEDLERRVRLAGQELAALEDRAVLNTMAFVEIDPQNPISRASFSAAKNALRQRNVQHGFGVVVSSDVLTALETEVIGVKSGLDFVEQLLSTKVTQSNGLPWEGAEAIVVQASPAAYRMVRASDPKVRVLGVENGNEVALRLVEYIAVGELEPNRCVAIRALIPALAEGAPEGRADLAQRQPREPQVRERMRAENPDDLEARGD